MQSHHLIASEERLCGLQFFFFFFIFNIYIFFSPKVSQHKAGISKQEQENLLVLLSVLSGPFVFEIVWYFHIPCAYARGLICVLRSLQDCEAR